ncbi:hypothetical protein [Methanogenium marinum]|nr:hypothetical protein [Methanogenium marinum]
MAGASDSLRYSTDEDYKQTIVPAMEEAIKNCIKNPSPFPYGEF